jgi:cold shock CspA family protein
VNIEVDAGDAGASGQQMVRGTVVSWRDTWGWIQCPELGEGDVFAHVEDLSAGVLPTPGMMVSFQLGEDNKGRRRAKRIQAAGGRSTVHRHTGRVAAQFQPLAAPAPQPVAAPGPASFVGQRLTGQVTSWKDLWGWVSSEYFSGGDLFAHSEDVKTGTSLQPGSLVSFIVGTDNKGRLRALQIQPHGVPRAPALQRQAPKVMGSIMPSAPAKRSFFGAKVEKSAASSEWDSLMGSQIDGVVLSWRSQWGWFKSEGCSADIFAHVEESVSGEEPEVGKAVSFIVGRDQKSGKPRAKQWTILDSAFAVKRQRTT